MIQTENGVRTQQGNCGNATFGLHDILAVFFRKWRLIVGFPVLVVIVVAGGSLLMPDIYRARTKLLPPHSAQSGAASVLSQLGIAGSVVGAAGAKNSSELYVGMLRSRTVADRLIERFRLRDAFDNPSQEVTRTILEANTSIVASKDGLITIDVEDKDRKRAAGLANAYVQELINLTQVLAVTEAAQRRLFFERQLETAKDKLAAAEWDLKQGLDTKGVVSVDADSRAIVETMGRLRAQISSKEIALNSMRAFVTTANPDFARVQEELNSLKEEFSRLENGRPTRGVAAADPEQPGQKQAGLENIRLLRNVKYYQMLYELLAKQYEAARLDEAKQGSVVQVLDPAVEPERKYKPKRLLIVAIAGLVALFLALLWSFLSEAKSLNSGRVSSRIRNGRNYGHESAE
jgi:tyrosine-protein kinase Etk/Wzc